MYCFACHLRGALQEVLFMRVLIADDQEFIRRGLRAVLSEEKDIEVCAEAVDGRDALVKSLELRPDIVIMDIIMHGWTGSRRHD
jgi:two-component system, NarL family, response regulator LiaR